MSNDRIVEEFLALLNDDEKEIYGAIIDCLKQLGYNPQRQKEKDYVISYKHTAHNKQIAKMGMRKKAFFAMRFSACRDYPPKFADIVSSRVMLDRYEPVCEKCKLCKGDQHTYVYTFPCGTVKSSCGAYVIEIPNISYNDISDIKRLLSEQHQYFLQYV